MKYEEYHMEQYYSWRLVGVCRVHVGYMHGANQCNIWYSKLYYGVDRTSWHDYSHSVVQSYEASSSKNSSELPFYPSQTSWKIVRLLSCSIKCTNLVNTRLGIANSIMPFALRCQGFAVFNLILAFMNSLNWITCLWLWQACYEMSKLRCQ